MTRIKTAGIAAGFALALVVGVLAGGVLSTAQAEGPSRAIGNGDIIAVPDGDGGWIVWDPNGKDGPQRVSESDVADVVRCSIVDGCDVPIEFVTEDGEVVKTLIIRLEDPAPPEVAE